MDKISELVIPLKHKSRLQNPLSSVSNKDKKRMVNYTTFKNNCNECYHAYLRLGYVK